MSEFYAKKMQILRAWFANSVRHFLANCAQHFNPFLYGKIVCDTDVLFRVLWLVGSLILRVTIQLTLSAGCTNVI